MLQLPVRLMKLSLSVFAELVAPLLLLKYILNVLSLIHTLGRVPLRNLSKKADLRLVFLAKGLSCSI
jgi:hypothetical protein